MKRLTYKYRCQHNSSQGDAHGAWIELKPGAGTAPLCVAALLCLPRSSAVVLLLKYV